MKKKLTITNLALGNLKQRKKQYTTLIIGIVLAMFFSSSVLFFISCLISSNEEHDKRTVGDFYGYFYSPEGFIDAEKGKEVAVSSESPRGISSADTVASTHRD